MNLLNFNKMPFIQKLIIGGIPMLIMFGYLAWIIYDGANNRTQFYKTGFSSTVVSSNVYHGRAQEYHLTNGLKVYFSLQSSKTVEIGDSITKKRKYLYL